MFLKFILPVVSNIRQGLLSKKSMIKNIYARLLEGSYYSPKNYGRNLYKEQVMIQRDSKKDKHLKRKQILPEEFRMKINESSKSKLAPSHLNCLMNSYIPFDT